MRLYAAHAAGAATLRWTAPVLLAARGEDEDDKTPRKWTCRAYNGGLMRPESPKLDAPLILDLAGAQFAPSVVANLFHDATRIVGHVTDKLVAAASVDVGGIVSGGGDDAEQFVRAAGYGFQWQASLEADLSKVQKLAPGKSATINGQQFTGPLYVARASRIFGVAFLGRGADEGTSVTLAAGAADLFKEIDMDYAQWLAALGLDEATLNDAQKAKLKAKYDAEQVTLKSAPKGKDDPEPPPPAFDAAELRAAYAKHEAAIESELAKCAERLVPAAKIATLRAGALDSAAKLLAQARQHEWAAIRFEVEALKAQQAFMLDAMKAEAPRGPAIHSSCGALDGAVLEAAACQARNIPGTDKAYSDQTLQAAHARFRGRLGLQQMFLIAAAQNGYQCGPGERIHQGNCSEVIEYAMRAAATVLSLPNIMANVANKELLQGFMEVDQTWREIAQVRTVSDFKTVTSYRMLDNMEYEQLLPDGSMRHGQLSEETFTRKAKTYAKMFSLTREDIINDDMGALDDLRNRLGRGAAKAFNKVFWTAFINNSSFFTAARGNYITGATTTLLTDYVGLGLGIAAFDSLRSTAVAPATKGERIGGTPSILLVPPELETNALQIYANIVATTAATVNIYSGKYRPVKVHQLSDSTYTGYSALAWYLLRAPTEYPAMVVSFLNGVQTPTVASADAAIGRLGVDFHGYHDFGADQAEWLCGVKSKGAA